MLIKHNCKLTVFPLSDVMQQITRFSFLLCWVISRSSVVDLLNVGLTVLLCNNCTCCHQTTWGLFSVKYLSLRVFHYFQRNICPLEAPLPHFCLEALIYSCISLLFLIWFHSYFFFLNLLKYLSLLLRSQIPRHVMRLCVRHVTCKCKVSVSIAVSFTNRSPKYHLMQA